MQCGSFTFPSFRSATSSRRFELTPDSSRTSRQYRMCSAWYIGFGRIVSSTHESWMPLTLLLVKAKPQSWTNKIDCAVHVATCAVIK